MYKDVENLQFVTKEEKHSCIMLSKVGVILLIIGAIGGIFCVVYNRFTENWNLVLSISSILVAGISYFVGCILMAISSAKRARLLKLELSRKSEHIQRQKDEALEQEMADSENKTRLIKEFLQWAYPILDKITDDRKGFYSFTLLKPHIDLGKYSLIVKGDNIAIYQSNIGHILAIAIREGIAGKLSKESYEFIRDKTYLNYDYNFKFYTVSDMKYWCVSGKIEEHTTTGLAPSSFEIAKTEALWGTAAAIKKASDVHTYTRQFDNRKIMILFNDWILEDGRGKVESLTRELLLVFPEKFSNIQIQI